MGIGVTDHYSILEHATYSVASPEACSSIIWRTAEKAASAAEAMKVSAQELIKIGIVDEALEPNGVPIEIIQRQQEQSNHLFLKILQNSRQLIWITLEMRYQKLLKNWISIFSAK